MLFCYSEIRRGNRDSSDSIPIYPLQMVFYPPPSPPKKNDEASYMLLYIEGKKNKT